MTTSDFPIVFDVETTGLNPYVDEIVQLSIIDFDGNILFDRYLKPSQHTEWPEAEAIHCISPQMVADCPSIVEVQDEIQLIIDEATEYIGYNLSFDIGFLRNSGIYFNPLIKQSDVMLLFAPIWGDWNEYFFDYTWCKLVDMADYYKFEWPETAHNSLADCYATLFGYKKIHAAAELN